MSSVCNDHKNAGQSRWQDFNCRSHYDEATSLAAALALLRYYNEWDFTATHTPPFAPTCPVCNKLLSAVCGRAAGTCRADTQVLGYATTWAEWYRLMYQHLQFHVTRGVSSNHMDECKAAIEYIQTTSLEAYMSGVLDDYKRDWIPF